MRYRRLLNLLPTLLLGSVVSLGQQTSQNFAALAGNWHLSGDFGIPRNDPRLTITLAVNGNKVTGAGDLQTFCGKDQGGWGSGFFLEGQIAADGTFELTDVHTFPSPDRISIKGKVPLAASRQWEGKFYFPPAPQARKCGDKVDFAFVATPLPTLRGKYSGKFSLSDGSTALATLEVEQGDGPAVRAKLTISGRSKFPEASAEVYVSEDSASYVKGDELYLVFAADNGAKITAMGNYIGASEKEISITVQNLRFAPGMHALNYAGIRLNAGGGLKRQ